MERKIGEVFDFYGTKLKVVQTTLGTCIGCALKDKCRGKDVWKVIGVCGASSRDDKKHVIFVEADKATNEEPQSEKLNLLEILKNCPEGTELWSPILGTLKFGRIERGLVFVKGEFGTEWDFNPDSTITFRFDGCQTQTSPEPMLFPSREQRDWGNVRYYTPVGQLPKSWEEFCDTHEVQNGEAYIDDCCNILGEEEAGDTRDTYNDMNILPSKEACRQHLALMQMHQLRDCWRDGWKPEPNKERWCITKDSRGSIEVNSFKDTSVFLSFQDEERAEYFVHNFRSLIEGAGDLI